MNSQHELKFATYCCDDDREFPGLPISHDGVLVGFIRLCVIIVGLQPLGAQNVGDIFALLPCKAIDDPTLASMIRLDVGGDVIQEALRFRPDAVDEVDSVEAGTEADIVILQMQLRDDILRCTWVRSRGEGHDRDSRNFRSKSAEGGILGKKSELRPG